MLKKGRIFLVGIPTPNLTLTAEQVRNMILAEHEEYKLEVKIYKNAKLTLMSENAKLASTIFSMCTVQLKHKLESDARYEKCENSAIELLKLIGSIGSSFGTISYFPEMMLEANEEDGGEQDRLGEGTWGT